MIAAIGISLTTLGSTWQLTGWLLVAVAFLSALTQLFVLPDSIRAWRTGAEGETRTADYLASLEPAGFVVLHDRRLPGSRANIDHIVIGPSGVFVIETKNYGGRLRVRSGELYLDGRRRTGAIEQVTRQADAVSAALDGVAVGRILCVHRAEFPLFGRPNIAGVPIVTGRGLIRALTEAPNTLTTEEVRHLSRLADSRLAIAGPRDGASHGSV